MQQMSQLPIHQFRKKILQLIGSNRAVVISGKTGCGKSTQVPKYILQQWKNAKIAVCEPRRLAATSLAIRVSQELGTRVGDTVGYQIGMESKCGDNTKITYMTYGILIQQLLFNMSIDYTHIILDEVHERSLQMDFTFIALKKILDSQPNKTTKVIIMSATINSTQFAKHFSTHTKTNQFLKPTIKYLTQKIKRPTRGRSSRIQPQNYTTDVEIKFETEDYRQAQCIILPDNSQYKIYEYYADQIAGNGLIPQYHVDDDVRVRDQAYRLALRLIDQHLEKKIGDILIFVPGMFQIKYLKEKLIQNSKVEPNQIIQVHSAYSQQLYHRLFEQKIQNKVIIATNIGQSSITLPFCKTVIDFCLTRKNITIKIKGYSRFETRVASKANLMQRAGRVGRISDGTVYRLIPKQLYEKLDDFDIPEIQCVSLDMVILRAKQIDKTYNSNLFEDPYEVFFNAIQPPKFKQIHSAIQYLLKQQALQQITPQKPQKPQQSPQQPQPPQKFLGQNLKITRTGQFMVTMPCNIRISKMILYSLNFGITSTMIDIAAILLTQKQFFVHEEKRCNIEEFMHSVIGYDRGEYNDFLLRQRLFSHWRFLYFEAFKKKIGGNGLERSKNSSQTQNNNFSQTQKILEQFNNSRITNPEWDFCNDRGVSPWVMRDILRISQNIRQRLYQSQIKVQRSKEDVDNLFIIFCLCIAFEDTTGQIQWKFRSSASKRNAQIKNFVSVIQSDVTTEQNVRQFIQPLKNYQVSYKPGGFMVVKGCPQVMSKFMLPRHYSKGLNKNTSPLYRYLASHPAKVSYLYESTIRERVRQVTVLNDSINKVNVRPNHHEEYMLIADRIFDSKGKYYMGACALVEKKFLILIKMMTTREVYLQPHPSYQFYSHVIINQQSMQLPFLLRNQDIKTILQFRKINQQDKSKQLEQAKLLQTSKRNRFLKLLEQVPIKPPLQPWTQIFNTTVQKYKKTDQQPIHIEKLANLLKDVGQSYFARYRKWKVREHQELYLNFRLYTVRKGSIICAKCWPEQITVIEDLEAFCTEKKVLRLNQYRGSWVQDNKNLLCAKKHYIGFIRNNDQGQIQYSNILMYCPFSKTSKFTGQKQSIEQLLTHVEDGLEELQQQKKKCFQFECKICCEPEDYNLNRCIIDRSQFKDQTAFWKKITDHMYSKKHLDHMEGFLSCV